MDTKDLLKENEELKCALKELTKEKNTLEYLYLNAFMKILNSKKLKIKELEEQIKLLKSGNEGDAQKPIKRKKVNHVGSGTSSEEECSETFYAKDTDVEDEDEVVKCMTTGTLQVIDKVSPVKRFLESSDSGSKKEDDSETDLSQSQSQENYSQYLLKPYSNSISSDEEDECATSLATKKLNQKSCDIDVEGPGPSNAKRKKVEKEETTTHSSDLLEELLGDL